MKYVRLSRSCCQATNGDCSPAYPTLWHYGSVPDPKPQSTSEQLRREAEELRLTAQRLIEEAARLLAKSTALDKQVSEHERRKK